MPAPRHTTCGTITEPRWVLDDTGEEVIVAWCPTCDDAPAAEELSRPIAETDVSPELLLKRGRGGSEGGVS